MGYAVLGQCFETQQEAVDVVCATLYPQAQGSTFVSCNGTEVTYEALLQLQVTDSYGSAGMLQAVLMPPCDPLTFTSGGAGPWNLSMADGAAISAAIVAVWGLAFAWRATRRALGDHNRDTD